MSYARDKGDKPEASPSSQLGIQPLEHVDQGFHFYLLYDVVATLPKGSPLCGSSHQVGASTSPLQKCCSSGCKKSLEQDSKDRKAMEAQDPRFPNIRHFFDHPNYHDIVVAAHKVGHQIELLNPMDNSVLTH
jgi:hypothetical protein